MADIVPLRPPAAIPARGGKFTLTPGLKSLASVENWRWWEGAELPVDVTPASLEALEAELAEWLAPITPAELAARLEALRAHYPDWGDLSPGLARAVKADWLEDFDGYPARLFAEACRRWRNSEAVRAPTPGLLKAIVADDLGRLRWLAGQAARARAALSETGRRTGYKRTGGPPE